MISYVVGCAGGCGRVLWFHTYRTCACVRVRGRASKKYVLGRGLRARTGDRVKSVMCYKALFLLRVPLFPRDVGNTLIRPHAPATNALQEGTRP
jgi:hypothetical protein